MEAYQDAVDKGLIQIDIKERCRMRDDCDCVCMKPVIWQNQNGVRACDWHKLMLDAFTWENRNQRKWEKINA
jgi:hypothetical protein